MYLVCLPSNNKLKAFFVCEKFNVKRENNKFHKVLDGNKMKKKKNHDKINVIIKFYVNN